MDLISIDEAAKRGIERLRKPKWAQPEDHLRIDIFDGRHGPWGGICMRRLTASAMAATR